MASLPGGGLMGPSARVMMQTVMVDRASGPLRNLSRNLGLVGTRANATAGRINALSLQIAMMGAIGVGAISKTTKQFAEFERQILIAEIAAGDTGETFDNLANRTFGLSEELARTPEEMSDLVRTIQFFGIQSEETEDKVAEFTDRLRRLDPSLSAPDTAKNLLRLLKITRRQGETSEQAAKRFDALAGAIFNVGTNVTAEIGDLIRFTEIFKTVGVVSNITEKELVALSGAVADLTQREREVVTTAIIRSMTTEEFEKFATLFGMSADAVKEMRREDPIKFFQKLASVLQTASENDRFLRLMTELDIGRVRSARGVGALIANVTKLEELMPLVEDDFKNVNDLVEESDRVIDATAGRIDQMEQSLKELGIRMGEIMKDAAIPFVDTIRNMADALNDSDAALRAFSATAAGLPLLAGGLGATRLLQGGFMSVGLTRFLLTGKLGGPGSFAGRQTTQAAQAALPGALLEEKMARRAALGAGQPRLASGRFASPGLLKGGASKLAGTEFLAGSAAAQASQAAARRQHLQRLTRGDFMMQGVRNRRMRRQVRGVIGRTLLPKKLRRGILSRSKRARIFARGDPLTMALLGGQTGTQALKGARSTIVGAPGAIKGAVGGGLTRLAAQGGIRGAIGQLGLRGGSALLGTGAIPVIGQVILALTALAALAGPLNQLGDIVRDISDKAGPLGPLFATLGLAFEALAAAGFLLREGFDLLMETVKNVITGIVEFLKTIPGVKEFFEGIEFITDQINEASTQLSEWNDEMADSKETVEDEKKTREDFANRPELQEPEARTGDSTPETVNNINIDANVQDTDKLRRMMEDGIRKNVGGTIKINVN